jgi:predicted nucleic acid-binding protein
MAENRIRLLLDLNLVMDVLEKREPHLTDSTAVWRAVETGQVEGYLAAHSITTLFYLVARQIDWQQATAVVKEVLKVFSIATVDEQVIHQGIHLGWRDFEDAVQMAAASQHHLDYIVSRNPKDFEIQPVPVLSPAGLLALLRAEG